MQQVEDRWNDAVTKRDQYALELVLAPQFIGISASGDVTTRNQQIAKLFVKGGRARLAVAKGGECAFRGGHVAIVNGTYVMSWKTRRGSGARKRHLLSRVLSMCGTNWLCLNSQRTVVAEDSRRAATPEKPKSKRSDAELPMHIPLVYKGPQSTQPPPKPGTDQPPSKKSCAP